MTGAPTIATKRLRLRGHRAEDFDALVTLFGTKRSVHVGGPLTREQLWPIFASDVGSWNILGHGCWAIERVEDGSVIGQVGINKLQDWPEVELGWMLFEEFEGHSYAFEAACAARAWAFGERKLSTLVSYIDPDNARSIRLAERLGAILDTSIIAPDACDLVFRHPAPEVLQ